jgi:hypothetical protein
VGGIQWAEIAAYLRYHPQADELRFCEIMRRLDHEYLDQRRSQAERKAKEK